MPDTADRSPASGHAAIVVLVAGAGTRVGADVNKALLDLGRSTVIGTALATALAVPSARTVLVVVRPGEQDVMSQAVSPLLGDREVRLLTGGATRHQSELHALRALAPEIETDQIDVVAIHDGARPLAPVGLFEQTIAAARKHGGAVPGAPLSGLVDADLRVVPGELVGVQTPQAFRARDLLEAYRRADTEGFSGTDTAACFARYAGLPVVAVPSSPANLKVTFAEDVAAADALSAAR